MKKSNAEPRNWLVPDLVTALMTAPDARPHSASNWLVMICTSWIDSLAARRLAADVRAALLVGVVGAVEDDVVGGGRLAVGLEAVVQELAARDEDRAGHVADERHVVAVGRRQLLSSSAEMWPPTSAVVTSTSGASPVTVIVLGNAADFQCEIERRGLTDVEGDAAPIERLEALELGRYAIPARHHLRTRSRCRRDRSALSRSTVSSLVTTMETPGTAPPEVSVPPPPPSMFPCAPRGGGVPAHRLRS